MRRTNGIDLTHVALIMDGNRRWAKERRLPIFEGHRRGEERIEPIVDCAIEMGISCLTFWAFSTENWYREKKEVAFLLNLFRKKLDQKIDNFHRKNVKVNIIGNIAMFPADIVAKTEKWMEKTKNNSRMTLNLALSYGGRDEIIRAINKWYKKSQTISPRFVVSEAEGSEVTKEEFEKYLDTAGQPNPDLIIRTGGEKRLSGFLLWQSEYAELYFSDVYWPDFTKEEFKKAVNDYHNRKRRFGR